MPGDLQVLPLRQATLPSLTGVGAPGGSGRSTTVSRGPDALLAELTRQGFADIQARIVPVENDLIARALDTGDTAANAAGDTAVRSGLRQRSAFDRSMRRTNSNLTAEEQAAVDRRRELSTALDATGAEDTSRRGQRERSTEMLGSIVGLGRQIHNTAVGGLNAAADAASARANANSAANQAQVSQAIGLAGLAIMLI